MERSSDFSRRVGIILLAVFAVAALFIGRLVFIQVIDAGRLNAEAEDRRSLTREQLGIRGSIVDANGIVLAESVERYDITASPRHANEFLRDGATVSVDQALAEIAAVTGGRVSEMRDSLEEDPTANFAYLVKSVTIAQLRDVQALSIPWTYYDLRPSRTYPRGAVAGNLVGFMGTDGPLTGVEYYQNTCLEATNGTMTFARGSDGIRIPGSTVNAVEPVDGGKIQLTIDSDLQWFAQKLIHARGNELDAKWATAMVVRISDGHILAAADWPSVDPNNVNGSKVDDMGARLFSVPYEPGSVFKPIILAAMIDRGLLSPRDEFLVPSQFEVSKSQFIADYFPHGTLRLTATGILTISSNIGMNVIAKDLAKQDRYDMLTSFGIGSRTGVSFLGEDAGYIAKPDVVDHVTKHTQIFGQGITATSAQIASVYQTLGNGGVRMPLTLVAGCEADDGTVSNLPPADGIPVISESAAKQTLSMMETVATQGSMRDLAKVPGYRIAIKSGTAEVARNGVYSEDRIISVAGVAPAENPKFAVVVTFGLPQVGRTSSDAATTFAKLMGQALKYYRVPPSSGRAENLPTEW
jgi:cell division protein FtsI (penicillin-binding protein 3)